MLENLIENIPREKIEIDKLVTLSRMLGFEQKTMFLQYMSNNHDCRSLADVDYAIREKTVPSNVMMAYLKGGYVPAHMEQAVVDTYQSLAIVRNP